MALDLLEGTWRWAKVSSSGSELLSRLVLPAVGSEVSGRVLDAFAAPAGGARVELRAARGNAAHDAETGAEVDGDRELLVELDPARVSGRVVDGYGAPLAGARVRLRRADGTVGAGATSDAGGAFRLEAGGGG